MIPEKIAETRIAQRNSESGAFRRELNDFPSL